MGFRKTVTPYEFYARLLKPRKALCNGNTGERGLRCDENNAILRDGTYEDMLKNDPMVVANEDLLRLAEELDNFYGLSCNRRSLDSVKV